jgi:CRP/FNR family transcriptional regulator, cyclic AMP receptor protein
MPPATVVKKRSRTSATNGTVTLRLADSPDRLHLKKMELFAGLPERDLEILEGRLGMVRWPQGAETPAGLERRDHLFVVREGRLALYERLGADHEVMVAILEPGSIWSTLGGSTPPPLASLESAAISPLPAYAVEALCTRYPKLGRNLAALLSERCCALSETIAMVSEMRVEDRLRARLHQLAERFGVTGRDGIKLRLELTHAQWASLVGASREAVTTAFGRLKTQGDVILDGRLIMIPWGVVQAREASMADAALSAAR